jgi:4'-phosphopantetheinyl transferase EntD
VLERLVPEVVAWAETREDRLGEELFPSERRALGRAVDRRRREFVTGRACAREALGGLGVPASAIVSGAHGEPQWPAGIVGSITHCAGYRAAAVARTATIVALGIDAEPNAPLPDGVFGDVVHGAERDLVGDGHVDVGRLVFSAKEAIYKAWFPLTGRPLGFEDVALSLDVAGRTFRAALLVDGPIVGGVRLTELHGRWAVQDGVIGTAVAVPARVPQ